MHHYAAYDESGIWETGDTAEEALRRFHDAAQATPEEVSAMSTAPMTQRLPGAMPGAGLGPNEQGRP